jgi:hypothetical protein
LEEGLGEAFIPWWLPVLVIDEHIDTKNGEKEAQSYEVRSGRIFPVHNVLGRYQLRDRAGSSQNSYLAHESWLVEDGSHISSAVHATVYSEGLTKDSDWEGFTVKEASDHPINLGFGWETGENL